MKQVAIYFTSFAVQSFVCIHGFNQEFPVYSRWICLLFGLFILLLQHKICKYKPFQSKLGSSSNINLVSLLFIQLLTILTFVLILKFSFQLYADTNWMIKFVEDGIPFSRWLQSTAILSYLFGAIWRNPLFIELTPPFIRDTAIFLRLAGISYMFGTAFFVLKNEKNSLAIGMCLLSGVWIILSTGFLKSYPFMAPALLLSLIWITAKPLEQRKPRDVGFLLSIFATTYIGFLPFAGILILVLALKHRTLLLPSCIWMIFLSFCIISLLWPGTPASYFSSLYADMNLGEMHTVYLPYQGHSAGANSINFAWPYILSQKHAIDTLYILNYSGTLASVAASAITVILLRKEFIFIFKKMRFLQDSRLLFLSLSLIFEIIHVLRAIPKLGPQQDILFFFPFSLIFTYMFGWIIDRHSHLKIKAFNILYPILFGAQIPILYFVCIKGIPVY